MKHWHHFARWFNALSLRERVSVFVASMATLAVLMYVLALDVEFARQRAMVASISQKQAEAKALQEQLIKLVTASAQDPKTAAERARIAQLKAQLGDMERSISAQERKLTSPEQMRNLISGLLARNRGIEVVSMKSLPPVALRAAAPGNAPSDTRALMYRHGIELTVAGAYLDLLAYLADLERLPNQLYWGALEIDATNYPKHPMKLTVYTLSLDPSWLKV